MRQAVDNWLEEEKTINDFTLITTMPILEADRTEGGPTEHTVELIQRDRFDEYVSISKKAAGAILCVITEPALNYVRKLKHPHAIMAALRQQYSSVTLALLFNKFR